MSTAGKDFFDKDFFDTQIVALVDYPIEKLKWYSEISEDFITEWRSQNTVTDHTRWAHERFIDKEYVETFTKFQQYLWNTNAHWHNTLTAILQVQWLCESKGWPYRFMTFREGFGDHVLTCAPQFRSMQHAIDWNKWVFTDDNYGGLREFTLNTVNTWDDGYDNHPSRQAHQLFVEQLLIPRFPDVYR